MDVNREKQHAESLVEQDRLQQGFSAHNAARRSIATTTGTNRYRSASDIWRERVEPLTFANVSQFWRCLWQMTTASADAEYSWWRTTCWSLPISLIPFIPWARMSLDPSRISRRHWSGWKNCPTLPARCWM